MLKQIVTLIIALILDLTLGDPPNRFHPVVLMGNWLSKGRQLAPVRHRFWFGAGWTLAGLLLFSLPWRNLESKRSGSPNTHPSSHIPYRTFHNPHLTSRIPHLASRITVHVLRIISSAFLLKSVFAYRNLRQNVANVAGALADANLPQARQLTGRHLVSRETSNLTGHEVAGAAIESLAENITDSFTAPLMAYAIGGLPAAWAYRFVNTADAMWGYRTTEFEQLGKFPARLDDVLNWLPARLTGWLLVAAARLAGEDAHQAAGVMLGQHHKTDSPNAGWTMSAIAGALRVTLTKRGVYELAGGSGRLDAGTIERAVRVTDICVVLVVASIWLGLIGAYAFTSTINCRSLSLKTKRSK